MTNIQSGGNEMETSPLRFPADFTWGAATAAYQIEGAVNEDGRGPSIWDRFVQLPGMISDRSTGDTACDHFHRYKEDVQLMKALGTKAYRFSIAWPRVFPEGVGTPNPKGLDFYNRLVDELLANGIAPLATLYHWDLPRALQDRYGGWTSRDTSKAFADYSAYVAARLSDGCFLALDGLFELGNGPVGVDLAAPRRDGGEAEEHETAKDTNEAFHRRMPPPGGRPGLAARSLRS